ncbi:Scarecrow-like protein 14 [Striga hermonthica]|uniref:Scarecrow-like protein 14 n=1 Tax=Striga hermonthica TaxID=68872 RepID=A0A9N7RKL5_STRHE|nr:Scarecrow-like protein 14 [Striga hermonthica]
MNGLQMRQRSTYHHHPGFADGPAQTRSGGDSNIIEEDDGPTDYFGGVFDYIKQMLLEEEEDDDLDHNWPANICPALQAAEKYFYEALCSTDSNTDHHSTPAKTNKTLHHLEDEDSQERSRKQLANDDDDDDPIGNKYDRSLLCPKMNPRFYATSPPHYSEESSASDEDQTKKMYRKSKQVRRGRPKGTTKKNRARAPARDVVDLRALLVRCAAAVSTFQTEELLRQIRRYSSAHGDPNERLAHFLATALEARMAGTGPSLSLTRIPGSKLLQSYGAYMSACPFQRLSNIYANKSIGKHVGAAGAVHVIDFGILQGFQWPCIIHGLSLRPGGPPRLRITGIDLPQPGLRPAALVERTGRRLAEFCARFGVPFEYRAVAKRWEDVRMEDLRIEVEEFLVVNCMYRLRHVAEESMGLNSPRDAVLRLIERMKPRLFVHGVVNGTYNTPFFASRFREVLYHYSSLFDMMEATLPREDEDRLMYEREVFGREVMNVIACEGTERIERPETYRQWQARNQRACFRQLPLNEEIMREVKFKVRKDYHTDFMCEEDGGWILQGWKGRILYALSCWKPMQE